MNVWILKGLVWSQEVSLILHRKFRRPCIHRGGRSQTRSQKCQNTVVRCLVVSLEGLKKLRQGRKEAGKYRPSEGNKAVYMFVQVTMDVYSVTSGINNSLIHDKDQRTNTITDISSQLCSFSVGVLPLEVQNSTASCQWQIASPVCFYFPHHIALKRSRYTCTDMQKANDGRRLDVMLFV